ncbi:related to lipase [Rhynchosporium graminicola]|uniref:Related to lipase n=1 Tax=Rhynchosporium graminicola TaxID=2792576 RepID=A0A1E1L1B2_9HELO|nr:related to lipase [Rhynchosporium commune]
MARISLYITAAIIRFFQNLGRYCDLYLSKPYPQRPAFSRTISSTVGSVPGKFKILFYTPPGYDIKSRRERYPVLINFHGGGYTIGNAADDARWATEVIKRTGGVVVSVDYRLAPGYPFPTGIEDCVSAVLYLWKMADELKLDISRTAFSGFSAGGNFCYTAAIRLQEELKTLKATGAISGSQKAGKLVSTVAFYPAVDMTKSRAARNASNPNVKPIINPIFLKLFTGSYFSPEQDRHSPLLSPGVAPDQLLRDALPHNQVMITCFGDGLLMEAEDFRERLKGLGKRVDGYTVPDVPHGWDKWPSFGRVDAKRDAAYKSAAESLREFWS